MRPEGDKIFPKKSILPVEDIIDLVVILRPVDMVANLMMTFVWSDGTDKTAMFSAVKYSLPNVFESSYEKRKYLLKRLGVISTPALALKDRNVDIRAVLPVDGIIDSVPVTVVHTLVWRGGAGDAPSRKIQTTLSEMRTDKARPWRFLAMQQESMDVINTQVFCEDELLVGLESVVSCLEGFKNTLSSIQARIDTLEKAKQKPFPWPRLQLEKVETLLYKRNFQREDSAKVQQWLKNAVEYLGKVSKDEDVDTVEIGRSERVYISEIDRSVQPYMLYVPKRAKNKKEALPLLVYLHGYVPSYSKAEWIESMPDLEAVCERLGMILAVPFGRGNTDFLGAGQDDVLSVIADVKERLKVNEDKIYLSGWSMGGSGVWTTIAHYPSVFAAGLVIAGRTDYRVANEVSVSSLPKFKQRLIRAENPLSLAENFRNVPVLVFHAKDDKLVDVKHSRLMVARLRELGYNCEYTEVPPGNRGHFIAYDILSMTKPFEWLLKHTRVLSPTMIDYKTYSARYAQAYWLSIPYRKNLLEPTFIRARPTEGNVLVKCENVGNGAYVSNDIRPEATIAADSDLWKFSDVLPTLVKTTEVCGPVKDAFANPFTLVHGADADSTAKARRFKKEWYEAANGVPPMVLADEVSKDDIANRNLILFGTPRTNSFLGNIEDYLGVRWLEAGWVVGGKYFDRKGKGVVFIAPNPLNPKRYIVVMDGLFYGDHLSFNHKWDLVPDVIVFDARKESDGTNKFLLAGFKDSFWKWDPTLIELDKEVVK